MIQINPRELLKKYFGYDNFRNGQEEIINHILSKHDCLAIMPTGAGKSICYQIPAMILEGVTIVISPLISLMKDQVDSLNQIGIPSTFVNSTLSSKDYMQTMYNIQHNVYKIIYVAPERLDSEYFINLLNSINVSMFAIDEAHCVSQWGHDFRPSYREVAKIILNLKQRPIVTAFTATATTLVKEDIISLLHLENPYTLVTGFDRKNLYFSVEVPTDKKKFLMKFVEENKNSSGIIYCQTRKNVDSLFELLKDEGYSVSKYHAGMSEKTRTINQEDFVYDRTSIMVATNAFGMGIDKSNIRYVIHYNMPKDLESYYQEAGRAGRDGDKSKCILLFSRADIITNKFLIENTPSSGNHKVEYDKLSDIIDYCNTDKCLRKYILEYFNEVPTFDNCDNCGNCLSQIEKTDITVDAKKILSCIKRMDERFGSGLVTDVLKGSKTAKIMSLGFDKLSTYGIMGEYSKDTIKDLIYFLITEGYIENYGDKYPVLKLSPFATNVLFGDEKIYIKRKIQKEEKIVKIDEKYDEKLFEILRDERRELANKYNVPPFIILTDVSLKQMATNYPTTPEKMLKISGIGAQKLANYGEIFINAICEYVKKNNIDIQKIIPTNFDAVDEEHTVAKEKINKTKGDTNAISYDLYMEGKTIKQIAEIRGISERTIEEHLLKCYENGMEINLEQYVKKQYENQIYQAIQRVGVERLRPIKDALPEEVDYFDIKYYLIQYKKL